MTPSLGEISSQAQEGELSAQWRGQGCDGKGWTGRAGPGGGRTSYQPSSPSRLSKETNQKNFNNLYGTKGNYTSRVWEYTSTVQNSEDMPTVQGNSSFSLKGFPSLLRSQVPKAQPQTWKSGKQTLLSHYRPFYVNKGSGIGSNEAP